MQLLTTRIATPSVSQTPKEVYVCKLLHLVDIHRLHHFLIVEQNPGFSLLLRDVLSDERHIVSGNVSGVSSRCALAYFRLPCVN